VVILNQVCERQTGSLKVVQFNVGHPFSITVSGNGNNRKDGSPVIRRIYGNYAFNAAIGQQTAILPEQVKIVAVADDEVKIALLQKMVFNTAKHHRRITVAKLRDKDADGVTALRA
jgi:hypothetical protein